MKINSRYTMIVSDDKIAVVDMVMNTTTWTYIGDIEGDWTVDIEGLDDARYRMYESDDSYTHTLLAINKITGGASLDVYDDFLRVFNKLKGLTVRRSMGK